MLHNLHEGQFQSLIFVSSLIVMKKVDSLEKEQLKIKWLLLLCVWKQILWFLFHNLIIDFSQQVITKASFGDILQLVNVPENNNNIFTVKKTFVGLRNHWHFFSQGTFCEINSQKDSPLVSFGFLTKKETYFASHRVQQKSKTSDCVPRQVLNHLFLPRKFYDFEISLSFFQTKLFPKGFFLS